MSKESPRQPPHRLDPIALDRLQRRLRQASQAPWLHEEAARRLAERLPIIKSQPRSILSWGPDAASAGVKWTEVCPGAEVLEVARQGMAQPTWWARWRGTAARQVAPDEVASVQADLLWSNMSLHLVPDPEAFMARWRTALAPQGFLMCTTLGPGSLAGLRSLYAEHDWGVAHAPFTDMHDLGDMLVASGFADPVMDQETLVLTYGSADALLAELRTLGCNLDPQRFAGLRTPRWRQQLLDALHAQADASGRIRLEWELVYGHAFRAPDRGPAVSADTRIGLDEMKLMLRRPSADK